MINSIGCPATMIPRPLVIYGMSHATTVIALLTDTPCHVYYSLDYSDLRLLHDHGPINLGEKCVHLYSSILHPKLLNLFDGYWAYIDSKDQLVVNTRFMQQMRDSLEQIPNHVSFGFLNGNEHHVNTLTKNRFLREFLLPANPEFPFILDRPLISLASFDSHM